MSINPIKHLILMKQTNILDLFGFKSFHGSALHVGKMGLIIFTVFYLVINPQVIQERKISIHSLAECGLMLLSLSKNMQIQSQVCIVTVRISIIVLWISTKVERPH